MKLSCNQRSGVTLTALKELREGGELLLSYDFPGKQEANATKKPTPKKQATRYV